MTMDLANEARRKAAMSATLPRSWASPVARQKA